MEAFLTKYGPWLFTIYVILALTITLLPIGQYDTIFHEPFILVKYLTLPILAIAYFLYFFHFPEYRELEGDFKGCVFVLMFCITFIFISTIYAMCVNANLGEQVAFRLEGQIVELDTSSSSKGGTAYFVYIDNVAVGKILKLDVSKTHFSGLKEGQYYSEIWKKGSLGIHYR